MDTIGRHLLGGIVGAASSTRTTAVPGYRSERSQTDYARCVETVLAQAPREVPSTKSPWNPFGTDANAGRRDRNTIERLRSTCGLPPP